MSNHSIQRYLPCTPDYSTPLTLIETHPDFELTPQSVEWGLEAISGKELDTANELLCAFMVEQHTPQAIGLAMKFANHYAAIVRARWYSEAEKLIEGIEDDE
ncbi:hypothetical protein [Comamonas sp. 4034]|uniref:hypothetical protein n=1 Tax=Comamonas sp. 4034 TaxID=3156455 RepID=UPI003D1D8DA0